MPLSSDDPKPRGGHADRQRRARQYLVRLSEIERQVAAGQLVIRQATPEERDRYGIRVDVAAAKAK